MTIFDEQITRKPDRYPWTQNFINAMWAGHWTPNEFNFQSDYQQFHTVASPEVREIMVKTLSAIGQIEIAPKKFWARLGDVLPHPSILDLGLTMAQIEVIHNQAYEKLIEVLGMDDVFETNMKNPALKGRVDYLRKYLTKMYDDDRKQFVYSVILFTLFVENVSLFSQFYTILYYNQFHNLFKDTAQQVSYTFLEEVIHAQAGTTIVNTIRLELPELFDADLEARIKEEAVSAFEAESNLIDWMIGDMDEIVESGSTIAGISAPILKEYVKNRINKSLKEIGFDAIFVIDPEILKYSIWMDVVESSNSRVDFFYQTPTSYQKATQPYGDDMFDDIDTPTPENTAIDS